MSLSPCGVENGRSIWTDSLTRVGGATPLAELNDINGSPVIDRDIVVARVTPAAWWPST